MNYIKSFERKNRLVEESPYEKYKDLGFIFQVCICVFQLICAYNVHMYQ